MRMFRCRRTGARLCQPDGRGMDHELASRMRGQFLNAASRITPAAIDAGRPRPAPRTKKPAPGPAMGRHHSDHSLPSLRWQASRISRQPKYLQPGAAMVHPVRKAPRRCNRITPAPIGLGNLDQSPVGRAPASAVTRRRPARSSGCSRYWRPAGRTTRPRRRSDCRRCR